MPQTLTKPKQHIQQVDYIRAIASLAVAIFHLGGKSVPILKYGWLGVQMFFLLSGFIICWAIPKAYSWNMAGKFLSKRILRIEPPYIISIALVLLLNSVFLTPYKPDWLNVIFHLAYLNNFTGGAYLSPVYWTLGIEFQYYIFIALRFPFIVKKWGAYFVVALCFLPLYLNIPGSTLAGVFAPFALGIIYYLYLMGVKGQKEALLLGLMVTTVSVHISGLLVTAAELFALAILVLPLKSHPVISFLSKISFSLYLTHDTIGSRLVIYMGTRMPHTIAFKAICFSTGFVVSILFAYLFYKLVEAPFFKLSKRITYTG